MERRLFTLFFLLVASVVCSQQQNNVWYFGEQAGLDFNTGAPVAVTSNVMSSLEGTASICTSNGNLLFYTNGGSYATFSGGIWNRNNQLMPNGDLTTSHGCNSSVQSCIIVPRPAHADQYYVFTTDCQENSLQGGLAVSLVDMTLDGGFGDVTTKDSVVYASMMNESLTAIPHSNGTDYWVISHVSGSYDFVLVLVTASGIQTPYTQTIGDYVGNASGQLVASVIGEKLAFGGIANTMLFDFDAGTGTLSNYINLGVNGFGVAFSPSCDFLYVNYPGDKLYQFDLTATDIPMSVAVVGNVDVFSFSMALGPDGKIYVSRGYATSLDLINQPDLASPSCDFQSQAVGLNGKTCRNGMPNFITSFYGKCGFNLTERIIEEETSLFQVYPNPADEYVQINFYDSQQGRITVSDVSGNVIIQQSVYGTHYSLSLNGLSAGMYFIKYENLDGASAVKRIVKE